MPRPKIIDFEGKRIPISQLPKGSHFIRGMWYSSVDALPPELKNDPDIMTMFEQSEKRKVAMKTNGTAIPKHKPAIEDLSVAALLLEFKRIRNLERQMRGFSKYFWDHEAEHNVGDDVSKARFVEKCAKLFGLSFTSMSEHCDAWRLLKKQKSRLGAALMKKTYFIEKGEQGMHSIVLHLKPMPMRLPREGEDGFWLPQNEYAELCKNRQIDGKFGKRPVKSIEDIIKLLQDDREENKGRIHWAEDLTPDDHRWGKDCKGRIFKKNCEDKNSPYLYFVEELDHKHTQGFAEKFATRKKKSKALPKLFRSLK